MQKLILSYAHELFEVTRTPEQYMAWVHSPAFKPFSSPPGQPLICRRCGRSGHVGSPEIKIRCLPHVELSTSGWLDESTPEERRLLDAFGSITPPAATSSRRRGRTRGGR